MLAFAGFAGQVVGRILVGLILLRLIRPEGGGNLLLVQHLNFARDSFLAVLFSVKFSRVVEKIKV